MEQNLYIATFEILWKLQKSDINYHLESECNFINTHISIS